MKIAELGATGDPVLIAGDTTGLKKEASMIAEVTARDVKIDTFSQNQRLSKQPTTTTFYGA